MASSDVDTTARDEIVKHHEYTYAGQTLQKTPTLLGIQVPVPPTETLHGRGVCYWGAGDRYEGEYRDGDKHGRGVYTWPDGRRYEGEWHDDRMGGRGIMWLPGGRVFDGAWANGCPLRGTALEADGRLARAAFSGRHPLTKDNWAIAERVPLGRVVAGGAPPQSDAAGAVVPWTGCVEAAAGAVYKGWLCGLRPCWTGVLVEGGARFQVERDGA
jgi:hypothetical protein